MHNNYTQLFHNIPPCLIGSMGMGVSGSPPSPLVALMSVIHICEKDCHSNNHFLSPFGFCV
jgi:hypothetical protein